MGLEAFTYISTLTTTNPTSSDPKSQGDDHIRGIKTALVNSFPAVAGAVSATNAELSYVSGVTSAIQTQINAKAPSASPTFTGTPAAPTAAIGTNTAQVATTAFVANQVMTATLPGQTGKQAGSVLVTDGLNASWSSPPIGSVLYLSQFSAL